MPWTPGPREPNSRFRRWFRAVSIGDDGTAPVRAPLKIKPTAAPTATSEAGDVYFDSTRNALMISNGTSYLQPGGFRTVKIGAAAVLTAADCGALCVWSTAAGYLFTLPAPQVGLWFDFVVDTTITSVGAKVLTDAATTFIRGAFLQIPDTAAQIVAQVANGTTHRSWNGNGSTTGGINGDSFRLTCVTATQWEIQGIGLATGTEASPFATS